MTEDLWFISLAVDPEPPRDEDYVRWLKPGTGRWGYCRAHSRLAAVEKMLASLTDDEREQSHIITTARLTDAMSGDPRLDKVQV